MTRSPFTLAASVTKALPGAMVIGAGALSHGATGRYDSAVVLLQDGTKVVVRAAPVGGDAEAERELAAETMALRALTAGARSRLGFRAPSVLGQAGLGDARALVVDFLPGYQVDAQHIPAGDGIAPSIGRAIAAVHALPTSVVRDGGLTVRTNEQSRADVTALLDRAIATRRLPAALASRWRAATEDDALWAFKPVVVLGHVDASSFLIEDRESGPGVSGVLGWHGLAVGDPALDLHWIASAPEASTDIYAGYAAGAYRTPDANLHARARLLAELEFAKWLVHGHELHRADIVDDAVALLDGLVAAVLDHQQAPLTAAREDLDIAAVEDLLSGVPIPPISDAETSFQTDAYHPDMLSLFEANELRLADAASAAARDAVSDGSGEVEADGDIDAGDAAEGGDGVESADGAEDAERAEDATRRDEVSTAPIDIAAVRAAADAAAESATGADAGHAAETPGIAPASRAAVRVSAGVESEDEATVDDAKRATRAAFRRWARTPE